LEGLAAGDERRKPLSFDAELAQRNNWGEYRQRFVATNGDDGQLIRTARKFSKKASTGEVSVRAAMLHAGNFTDIADEISQAGVWTRFGRTRDEYAEAVALAIMRS
jgi:hypothetical protein